MNPLSYKTNFLPLELQSAGLRKIRCLVVGTTLLAVIFLGSCWLLAGRCASLKKELAIVQKEIQDLAPAYKNAENIKREYTAREGLYQEYTTLISQRQSLSEMLVDLNRIAPSGLYLVELEMGSPTDSEKQSPGKNMVMKGCTEDLSAVGVFLIELERLAYFQEIALDKVVPTPDGMSFQVTAFIKEVK